MAYDTYLADRIHQSLSKRKVNFIEKKMMGGLTFMVNDKMCVGVSRNRLMARINPEKETEALQKLGAEEMMMTGRKMKGFIFVQPVGIDHDEDLEYWIQLCLDFNPLAKSSKKKRKKQ